MILIINPFSRKDDGPGPEEKVADLIKKLKENGVVTIATDIVMAEPEENYAFGLKEELTKLLPQLSSEQQQLSELLEQVAPKVDNDRILAQELMDHNVVLGYLFHNDTQIRKGVLPSPLTTPENKIIGRGNLPLHQFSGYNGCLPLFLNASTQAGAVTNVPDLDGTVRHGLMLASYGNKLYATLALATAMNYLMVQHVSLKTYDNHLYGIQMGNTFIPTNSHGQILIPFWGKLECLIIILPQISSTEKLIPSSCKEQLLSLVPPLYFWRICTNLRLRNPFLGWKWSEIWSRVLWASNWYLNLTGRRIKENFI